MRGKETGQALLMVLVLLAIAPIMVVQLLGLTGTTLKSTDTVSMQTTQIYAADGATEYIMWKLLHKDWAQSFTEDGQEGYLSIQNCGTTVNATIIMRAVPGEGGMTLATEDVIQPTKSVEPSVHEAGLTTYEYTIILEQLSDNNTQGLDVIYDILPREFVDSDYVTGSSKVSIDGGPPVAVDDPDIFKEQNWIMRWPASGNFSSDPGNPNYFNGMRDFSVRQVKELTFNMQASLKDDEVYCNWVVLKPWNTVSGPQAPISVGSPDNPGVCVDDVNAIEVVIEPDPEIIPPGVTTNITYDIHITNHYGATVSIEEIINYLPPEFIYTGPTSNLTSADPQGTEGTINVNGIDRYRLLWGNVEFGGGDISLGSDETITLTFGAQATKNVSGSYYNEVSVILKETGVGYAPFEALGLTPGEYSSTYSWNQGAVTVPTFDTRTESGSVVLDSNLSTILGGISINSYHFR